jgi:DNA-binding CsgD family transcriptional regulator
LRLLLRSLQHPPYGLWLELTDRYQAVGDLPDVPNVLLRGTGIGELSSQAELFAVAQDFVRAVAAVRPVILKLEDIHWADRASLDLLRYLARQLDGHRIMVVATYRDVEITREHPLFELLPSLIRESSVERIDLQPLSEADIHELIRSRWDLCLADEDRLVDYVLTRGEGNPLFIVEILRALELSGAIRCTECGACEIDELDPAMVPLLLLQAIERRLSPLGDADRRALEIASVFGQQVPIRHWQAVAELSDGVLDDVMDQAIRLHLLEDLEGGSTASFTHALVCQALYQQIPSLRRVSLHRSIAESLLSLPNPEPNAVAYHLQHALDVRAAEWLLIAGGRAERSFAWADALVRYDSATEVLKGANAPEAEIAQPLLRSGRLLRLNDPERGLDYLRQARRAAMNANEGVLEAYILFYVGLLECHVGHMTTGIRFMHDALATLKQVPDDIERHSHWTQTLPTGRTRHQALVVMNGTLSLWYAASGNFEQAISTAERNLDFDWRDAAPSDNFARTIEQLNEHQMDFHALGLSLSLLGRVDEALIAFKLSRRIVREMDHPPPLGVIFVSGTLASILYPYFATKILERRKALSELRDHWNNLDGEWRSSLFSTWEYILLMEGHWDDLRASIAEHPLATAALVLYKDFAIPPRIRLAMLEGELARAQALVRDMFPEGPGTKPGNRFFPSAIDALRGTVELALLSGKPDTAREWLAMYDRWLAWSGMPRLSAENFLLEAMVLRKEGKHQEALRVARDALRASHDPDQPLNRIAIERLIGELEIDLGSADDAAPHLIRSAGLAEISQIPHEHALSMIALAKLKLVHGDSEAAAEFLELAYTISDELGAQLLLSEISQLQTRLDSRTTYKRLGLTSRELDVLELLSLGYSDKEIADQLFISPRTVMNHVSNILRKLDVPSRTAAAAEAHRLNLL